MGRFHDGSEWWDESDGDNFKAKGYEDYKADSFEFKEEGEGESRGERSEWKQYADRCYSDSKEGWGDYSDYAGEDSERDDAYKEWGFGKEEWEATMGESTDYSKWTEDEYKGKPSEEYKETYKWEEKDNSYSNGCGKKILEVTPSQVIGGEQDVQPHIKNYTDPSNSCTQKILPPPSKDQKSREAIVGCQIISKKTKANIVHQTHNNLNNKTGIVSIKKDKRKEWEIKDNPYRHYIKPEKGDYDGVDTIWIIVFIVFILIKYYNAIKRIVKLIKMLGR